MILFVINLVSVICSIVMAVAALELYRLTRSTGVFVLLISCLYLTAVRLTIAGYETFLPSSTILQYRSPLIAPFWPLMALGFLLLLRSLRSLYRNGDDRRGADTGYDGLDRRKS